MKTLDLWNLFTSVLISFHNQFRFQIHHFSQPPTKMPTSLVPLYSPAVITSCPFSTYHNPLFNSILFLRLSPLSYWSLLSLLLDHFHYLTNDFMMTLHLTIILWCHNPFQLALIYLFHSFLWHDSLKFCLHLSSFQLTPITKCIIVKVSNGLYMKKYNGQF